MPKLKALSNQEFLKKLKTTLTAGLGKAGIELEDYSTEPIKGTKLHRVILIADAFDRMTFSERHDLVWRIVDQAFSPDDQLRISMIAALGAKEAVGV
jgi:stress-induced morphogen